ncbi:hypothetical protein L484_012889 [Morus notabilis]|uniref:HAT C-terminal dimerisation domain-containing protein n=1 Tax=Morus notabilis TaxID=981085 RepID=W9RFH0_9ROSA|nr:hypothetical protein L484_012889 [Morus notabilis]
MELSVFLADVRPSFGSKKLSLRAAPIFSGYEEAGVHHMEENPTRLSKEESYSTKANNKLKNASFNLKLRKERTTMHPRRRGPVVFFPEGQAIVPGRSGRSKEEGAPFALRNRRLRLQAVNKIELICDHDMSTVTSEQAFSASNQILDDKRSIMYPDILEGLMCVKD